MTKIILENDGVKNTIEFEDNLTGTELLSAFCSLMIGQTYLVSTVTKALKEVLDDYNRDIILNKNNES